MYKCTECEECNRYNNIIGMNPLDCNECEVYNEFIYNDYTINKYNFTDIDDDKFNEFIKYINNNWVNIPISRYNYSIKYEIEQYAESLGIRHLFDRLVYDLDGYYHINYYEEYDSIIIEPKECDYLEYITWLKGRIKWLKSSNFKKSNIMNIKESIETSQSMLNIMHGLIPIIEEVNERITINNLNTNEQPIIRYTYKSEVLDDIKIADVGKLRVHKYFCKNEISNLNKSNCKSKYSDLKMLKSDAVDDWGVKHKSGSYIYKGRIIEPTEDLDLFHFEIRAWGGLKLNIEELKDLNCTISELIKLYDKNKGN